MKYVFIDESGEVGLTNGSKPFFVISAIVASESCAIKISNLLCDFKHSLDWNEKSEFKFSKTNKKIIASVLRLVGKEEFKIYNVIYAKSSILKFTNNQSVYNNLLVILLGLIRSKEILAIIDGNPGKKYQRKVKTFIRKTLSDKNIIDIKYRDSKSDVMIQLADLISGAKFRSLQRGNNTAQFYKIVENREALTKFI